MSEVRCLHSSRFEVIRFHGFFIYPFDFFFKLIFFPVADSFVPFLYTACVLGLHFYLMNEYIFL